MRLLVGLGAALTGASIAPAETPSPALIGVQKVVLVCDLGPGFSDTDRRSICDQLVRRAKQATSLPVTIGESRDKDPLASAAAKNELLLNVSAKAQHVDGTRKSLAIKVTPVRPARPQGAMAAKTSTASLVRVQDRWVLQGEINAFHQILGGTRGRSLRAPVTSDRS